MSPLVFALLFLTIECLVAVFGICLAYVRMKSRVDDFHVPAHAPNRAELAGRVIAAYESVQKAAGEPGAEQMLGRTGRQMVIETLRGLGSRLAEGDAVSPLYCDQVIKLCSDLAGVSPAPAGSPTEDASESAPSENPVAGPLA